MTLSYSSSYVGKPSGLVYLRDEVDGRRLNEANVLHALSKYMYLDDFALMHKSTLQI